MCQGAHDATNRWDNPFWLYSLEQYKQPGCADFLLNAQDQYHLDINILLFIGWLSTQHKLFQPSASMDEIHNWQIKNIRPIRQLRQRIKLLTKGPFYEACKQLELTGEQAQQALLFQVSKDWPTSRLSGYEVFESSIKRYLGEAKIINKEGWLQALYQHLQP